MEFEKSLFRMYAGMMGRFPHDENNGNSCIKCFKIFEITFLTFGIFFLFCLIYLHLSFVSSSGCLPDLLLSQAQSMNVSRFSIAKDVMIGINIASDIPFFPRSKNAKGSHRNDDLEFSEYRRLSHILRGSLDSNVTSSRKRTLNETLDIPTFDYQFSYNFALANLPAKMRGKHQFHTVNVTMGGSQCFGGAFTRYLIVIGGMDVVVLNAVMSTVNKKGGVLYSSERNYFKWTVQDVKPYDSMWQWVIFKLEVLFKSLAVFCSLSCVTALLLRIVISSGYFFIYPIVFWMFGSANGLIIMDRY